MTTPIILSLTCLRKKILIPLINISYMEEVKAGGKSRIVLDDEKIFEVDEKIDQIETALSGLDLVRKPANQIKTP